VDGIPVGQFDVAQTLVSAAPRLNSALGAISGIVVEKSLDPAA